MYPVNREEYRQEHQLRVDDPVPSVEVWPTFYEIHEELDKQNETCFVKTVAQFFLHEITLEDYFDRLISHLEVDATLHTFDNAKSNEVDDLLRVDLISGAVKSLMLNESFHHFQATDAAKLKRLCVLTYNIEDAEELRQEAAAAGVPLISLAPHWLDILAVIAYARRHVAVLEHLVTYSGPSTKSTFDSIGSLIISNRQEPNMAFQHSIDSAENRLIEIRLWTALLQADGGWIHYPMAISPKTLHAGLQWLIDYFEGEPQLRASPEVERLCHVLSNHGIITGAATVSRFLSITAGHSRNFPNGIVPCSMAQATMLLECFPMSKLELQQGQSADLILPLTQWDAQNADRLAIMRMLLEQGCDPNDKISDHGWPQFLTPRQRDTALHLAAERGDGAMVDLLLEYSARGDLTGDGGQGDTPAERARAHGHLDIAARIEG